MQHADFSLELREAGQTAVLTGDWTAVAMGDAGIRLGRALASEPAAAMDLNGVERCDTAGAFAILKAGGDAAIDGPQITANERITRLMRLVRSASKAHQVAARPQRSVQDMLERLGRGLVHSFGEVYGTVAFIGHLITVIGRAIINPRRLRWAAIFSLAERAGLDALPIVVITTFFIGAVVGFLGANELSQLGAQVFAVDLIGISVMREFNIVITAVLLSGRSASSFAAEIGSMKMNQEIDAMTVMGVDPFEALVLPRFLALFFTIPILTFAATLAGLGGGILVCWTVLGISPAFFLDRLTENVGISQFWIGMSKGPVMAAVVACIGCRQGMEVGGDVDSLGRRVTSAVVHAIFSIIMIDAVFALVFMELKI